MFRKLGAICAAILMMIGVSAPASAGTNPTFTSTFSVSVDLGGGTKFTLPTNNAKVEVNLDAVTAVVAPLDLSVKVQEEVCGTFGCNWKGYKGITCKVTPKSYAVSKTCNFTIAASTRKHRLVFTKANDGVYYTGSVTVS